MTTTYRLAQTIDGQIITTEFSDANVIPAMEVRGFAFAGLNSNHRQCAELQGAPKFSGVVGPFWDGDAIRYEDASTYAALSN